MIYLDKEKTKPVNIEIEKEGSLYEGFYFLKEKTTYYVYGDIKVHACTGMIVKAYDNVTVDAGGEAIVFAYQNATVDAYHNATIYSYEYATVNATCLKGIVNAYGYSKVNASCCKNIIAYNYVRVNAKGSQVKAYHAVQVTCHDSKVDSYDESTVHAYHKSTVWGNDKSTVHVHGTARITKENKSKVYSFKNSIMKNLDKKLDYKTWHGQWISLQHSATAYAYGSCSVDKHNQQDSPEFID